MRTCQQKTSNQLLWQGKGKHSNFQESICISRRRAQIHQSFLTTHIFPKPLITTSVLPSSSQCRGTALKTKHIMAAQPSPMAESTVNYLPCLLATLPVHSPPPPRAAFTTPLTHSVCIRPQLLPHRPKTSLLAMQLLVHTRCSSPTQAPHCLHQEPAGLSVQLPGTSYLS